MLVLLILDLQLLGKDDVHLVHVALLLKHPGSLLLLELCVQFGDNLRVLGLLDIQHFFVVLKLTLLIPLENINLHFKPLLHFNQL